MNTIVDTDVLLGLFNSKDSLHSKALSLATKLAKKNIDTYALPTTLCEFALVGSSKIGTKEVKEAIKSLINSGLTILEVSDDLSKKAIAHYEKQTSKEESLFDCYIMMVANNLGIKYIFSFDKGYSKKVNGFLLASDMA